MKRYRSIIVCGRRGSGKSTTVKEKIISKYKGKKFIYDVNKEYEGGVMMDMDKFHEIATGLSNTLIIYEEATIFFSNKGDIKSVREMLVRARHTNNIIVFIFHGLQYVPLNIMTLADLMILKKTNDNPELVYNKFKNHRGIFTAYNLLKIIPNEFHSIFIPLGN